MLITDFRVHLGPGEAVGGVCEQDSDSLSPIDGLRPHQQHREPGQEAQDRVSRHIHGAGPGGACSQDDSAGNGGVGGQILIALM